MTINEAIERLGDIRMDAVAEDVKGRWLAELEGQIYREVVLRHKRTAGKFVQGPVVECPGCGSPHIRYFRDLDANVCPVCGWSELPPRVRAFPEDGDVPLVVKGAYANLYLSYLQSMVDLANREYDHYNNGLVAFQSELAEFKLAYHRAHMPVQIGGDSLAERVLWFLDAKGAALPEWAGVTLGDGGLVIPYFTHWDKDKLDLGGDDASVTPGPHAALFTPKEGSCWADTFTAETRTVEWVRLLDTAIRWRGSYSQHEIQGALDNGTIFLDGARFGTLPVRDTLELVTSREAPITVKIVKAPKEGAKARVEGRNLLFEIPDGTYQGTYEVELTMEGTADYLPARAVVTYSVDPSDFIVWPMSAEGGAG